MSFHKFLDRYGNELAVTDVQPPIVDVTSSPAATGNTAGPRFEKTTDGAIYYVDSTGRAEQIEATKKQYAGIVYVDTTDPNTATIFDLENPATTDDPALKQNTDYIYADTSGKTWTWDTAQNKYISYEVPATTEWYFQNTTTDAGGDKSNPIWRPGKQLGIGGFALQDANVTMYQDSKTKGMTLTGYPASFVGNWQTTPGNGVRWMLGVNINNNVQHWFGDYNGISNGLIKTGYSFVRMMHIKGTIAVVDAASGPSGDVYDNIHIGQAFVSIGTTNLSQPLYTAHVKGTFGVETLPTYSTATDVLVKNPTTKQIGVRSLSSVLSSIGLDVLTTPQAVPTATGNTTNLNTTFTATNGSTYLVDAGGDSIKLGDTVSAASTLTPVSPNSSQEIGTVTVNGVSTSLKESVTTMLVDSALMSGPPIAQYYDEAGNLATIPGFNVLTTIQPVPTATGNTTNKNTMFKAVDGNAYAVDASGDSVQLGSAPPAQTANFLVYVDSTSPATATIFDENNNPPTTNNDAMKNRDDAIYVGTDGSTWTSNGTTYSTYTSPAATEWNLSGSTTDAGSNKTSAIVRSGDIGVGVTSASANAHFAAAANTGIPSSTATNLTVKPIMRLDGGLGRLGFYNNTASPYGFAEQAFSSTGATLPLTVQPVGGNFGVGTTNPFATAHIYKATHTTNPTTDAQVVSTAPIQRIQASSSSLNTYSAAGAPWTISQQASDVNSGASLPYVVQNVGGNFGIGSNLAPAYKLDVTGDARITVAPTITTATKMLVRDPVTNQISEQTIPTGGTAAALTTTSLTPIYQNGATKISAQANSATTVADLIRLSDGTTLTNGKVTWTGHGLTVGSWYYTSQSTAGGYVTPAPTSGYAQKLFFVEDANTIQIDMDAADSLTTTASYSKVAWCGGWASNQTLSTVSSQNATGFTRILTASSQMNTSTGVFTAPRTGNYFISISFAVNGGGGALAVGTFASVGIKVNGVQQVFAGLDQTPVTAGVNVIATAAYPIYVNAGDTIQFWYTVQGNTTYTTNWPATFFSITEQ